jgi:hypothetical protein
MMKHYAKQLKCLIDQVWQFRDELERHPRPGGRGGNFIEVISEFRKKADVALGPEADARERRNVIVDFNEKLKDIENYYKDPVLANMVETMVRLTKESLKPVNLGTLQAKDPRKWIAKENAEDIQVDISQPRTPKYRS